MNSMKQSTKNYSAFSYSEEQENKTFFSKIMKFKNAVLFSIFIAILCCISSCTTSHEVNYRLKQKSPKIRIKGSTNSTIKYRNTLSSFETLPRQGKELYWIWQLPSILFSCIVQLQLWRESFEIVNKGLRKKTCGDEMQKTKKLTCKNHNCSTWLISSFCIVCSPCLNWLDERLSRRMRRSQQGNHIWVIKTFISNGHRQNQTFNFEGTGVYIKKILTCWRGKLKAKWLNAYRNGHL